jgi:hypothetical protein
MSMVKIGTAVQAVAAAGTAEPIAASKLVRSINIQANPNNVGDVYIGASDVDSSNGIILEPGQTMELESPVDAGGMHMDLDLAEIFVDAANNGDSVRVVFFERS